jgi:cell division protein FtsB
LNRKSSEEPQPSGAKGTSISKGGRIIEMEEAQKHRRDKRNQNLETSKLKKRETKVKERRKIKLIEKKSRRKLSAGKKLVIAVIFLIAVTALGFSGYKIVNLKLAEAEVTDTYEAKVSEKKKLEREYSMVNDPKYIEKQARERFNMIIEGEILYIYPEAQGDNSQ